MRIFFAFNLFLWCVLFVAWVPYVAMFGMTDDTSLRVGFILAVTAALLTCQGALRWARYRRARVSA